MLTWTSYNSGQVCISVQRLYSQKKVFEPFAEKFVKATDALVVATRLTRASRWGRSSQKSSANA